MKPFTCGACSHTFDAESIKPCPKCGSDQVTLNTEEQEKREDARYEGLEPVQVLQLACDNLWKGKGIVAAEARYDGEGDEGTMNEIVTIDENGDEENVSMTAIEAAFEDLAWAHVSGDNEGGGGVVRVDVKTKRVTRHEYYYERRETSATKKPEVLSEEPPKKKKKKKAA